MGLSAVTLLGDNTHPILGGLCAHLTGTGSVDVAMAELPPGDADLIWGCGYLLCELIDSGRLAADIVAAPVFAGQTEPVYHSVIVAADPTIRTVDDARGRVLAINEEISWSGHHALVAHFAEFGADLAMFERVVVTGSHRASVEAVAGGAADLASIDHTVWEHLSGSAAVADRVAVIGRTRDWPAPPFAVHHRVESRVRTQLVDGMTALPPDVVDGLDGIVEAAHRSYERMGTG